MSDCNFELIIGSAWKLLGNFYRHSTGLNVFDYVCLAKNTNARVLIDEQSEQDTVFFAIELPHALKKTVQGDSGIDLHALSVIVEEVSHFFHLVIAAQRERPVSLLQLEALAEIDRFVMFLHWNSFHPHLTLTKKFSNCAQVCDALFEQREFKGPAAELYLDAENLALHHLRKAFAHRWIQSHIDTRKFDPGVQSYLTSLFQQGPAALLCA